MENIKIRRNGVSKTRRRLLRNYLLLTRILLKELIKIFAHLELCLATRPIASSGWKLLIFA